MMDFDSIKKFCLTHKRMSLASNENTSIRDRVLLNEHILRKRYCKKWSAIILWKQTIENKEA